MNAETRRLHHLTLEESNLILCFRLLNEPTQLAVIELLRAHANEAAHDPPENVVPIQRSA